MLQVLQVADNGSLISSWSQLFFFHLQAWALLIVLIISSTKCSLPFWRTYEKIPKIDFLLVILGNRVLTKRDAGKYSANLIAVIIFIIITTTFYFIARRTPRDTIGMPARSIFRILYPKITSLCLHSSVKSLGNSRRLWRIDMRLLRSMWILINAAVLSDCGRWMVIINISL